MPTPRTKYAGKKTAAKTPAKFAYKAKIKGEEEKAGLIRVEFCGAVIGTKSEVTTFLDYVVGDAEDLVRLLSLTAEELSS